MRVALTGATGLLGSNLAARLRAEGHEVVATRRARSRTDHLDDLDLAWVEAALDDPEGLVRAFDGADVVFHCAAAVSIRRKAPDWMEAVNVGGTARVIAACREAGVGRLVHCSSAVCVGIGDGETLVDEDAPWNLPDHGVDDGYARTKYAAEGVVHQAIHEGLDAVIVNPGFMFGPRDARPSSGRMILDVAAGRVPGATRGRNSFVDVRDVAAGMVAAADQGRTGRRYLLTGENLSYAEIFGRIADRVGVAPPRFTVPRWAAVLAGLAGDVHEGVTQGEPFLNSTTVNWGHAWGYAFDSSRAREELGYQTRPVEEAIDSAVAWFRAHDML